MGRKAGLEGTTTQMSEITPCILGSVLGPSLQEGYGVARVCAGKSNEAVERKR